MTPNRQTVEYVGTHRLRSNSYCATFTVTAKYYYRRDPTCNVFMENSPFPLYGGDKLPTVVGFLLETSA
jgi:hypothetical protein